MDCYFLFMENEMEAGGAARGGSAQKTVGE